GRVTDAAGAFADYTTTISVLNVAPTASFSGSGTVALGGAGAVSFANPTDPSADDAAAGFKYSYDFDNDGTFEVANSASPSATVPASYLQSAGGHMVRGRIADKDG